MILELLITSTVLILGIFCLRKLTVGKISMRLRYALWLPVALRLLVPVSVGTSTFSVMNLLPEVVRDNATVLSFGEENGRRLSLGGGQDSAFVGDPGDTFFEERDPGAEAADGQSKVDNGIISTAAFGENAPKKQTAVGTDAAQGKEGAAGLRVGGFSVTGILGVLWLLGFLAVGGYMVISERRFIGYLHKNRKAFPAEEVPEEFAKRFSRRGMQLYQLKGLPGPCLAGRHVYIGEGTAIQEQRLTHVLAHEYCHARHGDGFWAFLRCLLAAVYWFDPFVWAAAYAARQDSELACDEAAIALLGESSRFDYGRTLLSLLENVGGSERCPGMTFMTEGSERDVRGRITALARKSRTKKPVLAAVLVAAVLICGCAFTGAEKESVDAAGETEAQTAAGTDGNGQGEKGDAAVSDAQSRQMVPEEKNEEFARIQKEYEENVKTAELVEEQVKELEERARQEAELAAFMEALNYHGVMEGRDDSELALNREVDCQTYYEFTRGEKENPMENGWYRICENEDAGITLYGLYTEEFGFRGLKTLIGEDVNTYDIQWYPALVNNDKDNILVLERADDGLPRRFVWKLPAVDSSTEEIWRLYSGYRHDTGTIDLRTLTAEECVEWANAHLTFDVDREAAKIDVTYDGDMYLGAIDISAYRDWETEDVQIVPDAVAFTLDDPGEMTLHYDGDEGDYQMYSDTAYEGTAVYLSAGLKLEGIEGLWSDGLSLLTVQVVEDENSDSGFRLEHPRIDKTYVANAPFQEKKLSKLRDE